MKKISLLCVCFIFLCITSTIGQNETIENENETEQSLKVYAAFQYFSSESFPRYELGLPNFSYNSTAIGYYKEYKINNRFTEWSFSFSKRSDSGTVSQSKLDTSTINNPPVVFITTMHPAKSNEFNIGLRYESGKWFKKISTEKIKIGLSTSLRLFYHFSNTKPIDSGAFPTKSDQICLTLGVVPRIRYNINSKVYAALQFPFELLCFGLDFQEVENPILTQNQKRQGGFNFDIGGEKLIRLGVGYVFR